ncbi:MAG: hypothetical protein EKK64_03625 [Neisseriaceae bacterium]|nr:MAG: hypothetical protein EKK64_03625 [Neisseriaceae bacterium]
MSNYKNNLSENIYERCCICNKLYEISLKSRKLNKKLKNNETCGFCFRNNFSKKVFIFNVKSLPAFLYVQNHKNKDFLKELNQYVSCHIKSGLKNPVFFYDVETMNWFVDLSKKKISKKEIKKTIVEILFCFNLWDTIPSLNQKRILKSIFQSIVAGNSFFLNLDEFGLKTSFSKNFVKNFKMC